MDTHSSWPFSQRIDYIQMITLGRPYRSVHKTVKKLMGAVKKAGLLQIRIYGNRLYIRRLYLHIAVKLRVTEAEDSEAGLVYV